MRNDQVAPDQHQIIHPNLRPLPPAINLLTDPQLRAHLATAIQKHPYEIALLDRAHPTGNVRAVVEDERDRDLRHLDRLLQNHELFPQALPRLRLAQQRALRQRLRHHAHLCVDAHLLLFSQALARRPLPRRVGRRALFRGRRLAAISILLLLVVLVVSE